MVISIRSIFLSVFTCAFFIISGVSNAALVSRAGGTMVYDTDLDITWLADANYAMTSGYDLDGQMTWQEAIDWVAQLEYGGLSGWRLPSAINPDGTDTCNFNCSTSEMGHLFYSELGGVNGYDLGSISNSNYDLFNNIQNDIYWFGTEYTIYPYVDYAWNFRFHNGEQYANPMGDNNFAWAVRDGDIGAVPLPAAFWLFMSGLSGIIGLSKIRKK